MKEENVSPSTQQQYDHYEWLRAACDALLPLRPEGAKGHLISSEGFEDLLSILAGVSLMGCKPPIIVADYDQSCRIVDRGGDGFLEQRHYTAYVLCKGSSTRPEEKRRAMAQARALADQLAARLIAHFYRGESGLRHLQADMIEVLDIGATGDQFQGVALRYSILRPRAARIDQSFWAQE